MVGLAVGVGCARDVGASQWPSLVGDLVEWFCEAGESDGTARIGWATAKERIPYFGA